jgi:hypothetical protein
MFAVLALLLQHMIPDGVANEQALWGETDCKT